MINNNGKKGSKPSEVSPREEVQTSSIVYNTEGCMCSEDLHYLYNVIWNLGSKGSDLDSSYNEINLKDSDSKVGSQDKSDFISVVVSQATKSLGSRRQ